jgi:hypothetical protein
MNYKKIILCLLILCAPLNAIAGQATNVVLYSYTFTWVKIELSSDGGNTWVTVFTGPQNFSLSSTDDVNAKISDIWRNVEIPAGTYNYIRATFGAQDTAKYKFDYASQTWYTSSGGFTTNEALFDNFTFNRSSTVTTVPLNPQIEIAAGQHKTIREYFNIGATTVSVNDITQAVSISVPYSLETI